MNTEPTQPELSSYSRIIVAFSGGKDSVACVLHLLELGVPRERIELWHHDVDGREGSELMDWPCTRAYCRQFADALGLTLLFSWKQGGFEGEMLRQDAYTRPISWENPDGTVTTVGGSRGKLATRRKFPQVSPDLSVRWCSAYLKIDVCSRVINGSPRFLGQRTLVVTGERAQESAARARYAEFEPHRSDNRNGKRTTRHVDAWRPVHGWDEREVWRIMKRWNVRPHPCYLLGFSRCSCMPCIFGNADQWATVRALDPKRFDKLAAYEAEFGVTLKRKLSLPVIASQGRPYEARNPEHIAAAMNTNYALPGLLAFGERWVLPAGAFGESCGPS
jgi:3'-phosphoadenosine 5'-phosphosulfate sulfotransferase (PAPS reductase)/FAD synthetase